MSKQKTKLKQITEASELVGKTIVKVVNGDELALRFDDDSFALFAITLTDNGFASYEIVSLEDHTLHTTDYILVELGVITEEEYNEAIQEEYERRRIAEEAARARVEPLLKKQRIAEMEEIAKRYGFKVIIDTYISTK